MKPVSVVHLLLTLLITHTARYVTVLL